MKIHQLSPQPSSNWSSQQLKRPQIKLSELAKFTKLQIPQLEDSKQAMQYKLRQQQLLRESKIKPIMKVLTKSQMLQGYLSMRPKHQPKSRSTSLLNKLSASSSKINSLMETPKILQPLVSEEKTPLPYIETPIKPLRNQLFSSALDILRPETPINFRCLVQDVSIRKQKISTKKLFADMITKLTILKKLDIHKIDGVIWNNRPFQKKLSYEFLRACKNGDLATVKELLEQDRFLVFSFDYIHQTALHWAVKRSHTEIAKWILRSGCNVDEQDLIGRPPLYFAVEQQNATMVKLLLEYNAVPWTTQRITYSKLCNEDLQIMLLLNKARKVHVIYRMVDPQHQLDYLMYEIILMYNQFIDEEGQERQIQYLVELGFAEHKARKGVEKFGYTISLEDLINRILDMSDDNSKKSLTHNKISLIQFSESGSEKSPPLVQQQKIVSAPYLQQQKQQYVPQRQQIPFYQNQQLFENEQFQQCQVCFTQPISWIHFECNHQFCQPCVVKNIKAQRLKKLELITCLQLDCHEKIIKDDAHLVSNELFPQMDIQPYNEPICSKCKLPQAAHRFTLFSNACDNAEFAILSACVKQDEEGNQLQRCPQCGIWVQKSKGCNSVLCSYCKFNWCWLCRRQCDSNHFVQFNPTGCPGLGSEEFTIEQWPWHKICWKRVKAVMIYFLLLMLCVIIYPFFVGQVIIRKMNFNFQGNVCYRITLFIFLGILFLVLSALAIFPGIIIFIVSPRARQYVFAR